MHARNRCLEESSALQKCSRCKLARYCSRGHQVCSGRRPFPANLLTQPSINPDS